MIHSFSADLATEFGILPAAVYGYVAYTALRSPTQRFTGTLNDICERIPYATRNAIHECLTKLATGTKNHEPVLLRVSAKRGHGVHYKVLDSRYTTLNLHRFNSAVATEHGLVAAIVYHNIGFWIRGNWNEALYNGLKEANGAHYDYDIEAMSADVFQKSLKYACHYASPEEWADHHPYVSRATAFRAFKKLVEVGLLQKTTGNTLPKWTLSDRENEYIKSVYFSEDVFGDLFTGSNLKRGYTVSKVGRAVSIEDFQYQDCDSQSQRGTSDHEQVPSAQELSAEKWPVKSRVLKAEFQAKVGEAVCRRSPAGSGRPQVSDDFFDYDQDDVCGKQGQLTALLEVFRSTADHARKQALKNVPGNREAVQPDYRIGHLERDVVLEKRSALVPVDTETGFSGEDDLGLRPVDRVRYKGTQGR